MTAHTITVEMIGHIAEDGGSDQYFLLTSSEDITIEDAIAHVLPTHYREGNGPGQYFCHTVRAVYAQYSTRRVILTVEHRYDV